MNEPTVETNRVIEIVLNGYEKAIQELKDTPTETNQVIDILIEGLHEENVDLEEWYRSKIVGDLIEAINARKDIVSISVANEVGVEDSNFNPRKTKGILYFLSQIQLPSSLKKIHVKGTDEEGLIDLDAIDILFKNNPLIQEIILNNLRIRDRDVVDILNSIRYYLGEVTRLNLDSNSLTEHAIKSVAKELEYARGIPRHPLKYLEVLEFFDSNYEYCPANYELILEIVRNNPQICKLNFHQGYTIYQGKVEWDFTSATDEIVEKCTVIIREIEGLLQKREKDVPSLLQLSSKEILKMDASRLIEVTREVEKKNLLKAFRN